MDVMKNHSKTGLLEIIDVLPVAVGIFEKNGVLILANRAVSDFTGKPREQLTNRLIGEVFDCFYYTGAPEKCGAGPDCPVCPLRKALLHTLATREDVKQTEIKMLFMKKGERLLRISTHALTLNGQSVAMLTLEDYTEVKLLEDSRLETEKLSAVLETAGAVCHEFSQPLQVISGYCEILLDQNSFDDETGQAISAIQKEVERMADMNHNLMNITRYETKDYLTSKIIDIAKSSAKS